MGFDMSKVECYNCHRSYDWSYQAEEEPANFALMAFSSSRSSSDNEVPSCSKACSKAYAQLHSQYDKLTDDFSKSQFDVISYQTDSDCKSWPPSSLYGRFQPSGGYRVIPPPLIKPAQDLSRTNRPTVPIIEDWVSDSEDESETKALQFVPSFVQSSKQVNTPRHSVQPLETTIPVTTPMPASPKPASSGKRRNRKACFVSRVSVSAVVPKIKVTRPRLAKPSVTKSKSPIRRHLTRSHSPKTSNSPPRVTAIQAPVVSAAQGNPQYALKDKGVIDSGCSRHMIGNISYLFDFEELNGSGPTWLFDIDSLTKTMNYQPVTAGNQTNPSAGFQDKFNAEKAGEEIDQQYISAQLRKQDDKTKKEAKGKSHVESFTGYRDFSAEFKDCSDNSINEVNAGGTIAPTVGQNSPNSANTFSTVELEDITYSNDEDDVGAEADFNNLETSITVSPILTTRVHKDHPVSQIISDLSSTTQTRNMIRVEPKRVHQALKDPSWIEAMQEELLQFKMKKEEGIDYEEVFAPIARIEAIRLFLAYASFMGFIVYQMDVKSAFLYETIEEEVYVCQPLGFEDPDHLDKVYKVVKPLYGLHQAPRA
nr:hypothetical protein [Tanacetum cinerariifolium]